MLFSIYAPYIDSGSSIGSQSRLEPEARTDVDGTYKEAGVGGRFAELVSYSIFPDLLEPI